jgi:hypothetical protein
MAGTRLFSRGRAAVRIAAAGGAVVVLCGAATASAAATRSAAHGSRPGPANSDTFVEGTDSASMDVTGNAAPYYEPVLNGGKDEYGGYIGMTGNWEHRENCSESFDDWSAQNSTDANADYADHFGIGTGVYWFMGGPGVDPHYNGTTAEAYAWGKQQAGWTLADVTKLHVTYPVIFADVEIPDIAPAPDNGWKTAYTSPCSGFREQGSIPANVDRVEFNGFAAYITDHSSYKVGVYSNPSVWNLIFGTGVDSLIPNTYEWTYTPNPSLSPVPSAWCVSAPKKCATFFGGQTLASKYALMWQWSGGGGQPNGFGDFDQIDVTRMP